MGFSMAAAYDRAITIFSPDGRIYQVEYAFEAVRRGWTTIGIRTKSASIVAAEKRKITPLVDEKAIQKIFKIDDHVGASYAGMAGDGRILINYAISQALLHRFYYDEPAPVEYLAKLVCDVKQAYTQHAGVRPFGVAMIIAGVDEKGTQLFMTEPSGRYLSYYATAIGEKSNNVIEFLEKNYKYDLDVDESLKLTVLTLAGIVEGKPYEDYMEIGYVDTESKRFKILTHEEIRRYVEELEKEGKLKA
ncbi:archaeal proteasome endopeptidase complex subunit alpha [Desulfurococcus mucosus]|uniref:Proteasome subunit alpha n=1 Tax=Desulfurococcus mucosus (strain ATCC 35584 / DSM 2162 / JCM 9187 / O7/1) TaxID=765177 RepID=E8R7E7_DESM0|nr:archaeal proteasome endopeptidase complex subunit alpha [Desulfurococcus mucosus]ADV65612.1 proteasome endopeptidase complex, alpha subunit [Desulfurococcus mucosus DSM 2162]